ncbi:MAG: 3-phosphoshikimate 1-carboxyvinyltransferase [Ignavibacteriales bacterium]|nr:3-phosphoshikimate 1-carboxyvinyltransferase [Ignavibacteriales bacterium]
MIYSFEKINYVKGELELPGDKSLSHRSVMFAAMAKGESIIRNCSNSEDVHSTMECFSKLGVEFEKTEKYIKVKGKGYKNFNAPMIELYAGNSGTTTRLISGILCAQNFSSIITGDESLSKRPMMRVVEPLRLMGANIETTAGGTLPMKIKVAGKLVPVNYKLQVASAQVKSALLLAALHLEEESVIIETVPTRNHTEKLLGLRTEETTEGTKIYSSKKNYPEPFEITVPSDISTAAFFIVLALLAKNSELIIKNVSLNETRTGIIEVLKKMGAEISIEKEFLEKGEKVGDLLIRSSAIRNVEIPESVIPNIIDEIPILAVAGIFAEGNFRINNAKELRVKESDRIKSLCHNFKLAGLNVDEFEDGFEISGSLTEKQVTFESFGDHRIAMAFSVLSMLMKNGGTVNQFESVGVSNPSLVEQLKKICK